jgi:hypothetical protein
VQDRCRTEEPLLERKGPGDLTACHFPLTTDELSERVAAVAAGGPDESGPPTDDAAAT